MGRLHLRTWISFSLFKFLKVSKRRFCSWLIFVGMDRLGMIDHDVQPGSHYVECQIVGEEGGKGVPAFKILGVFAT